VIITPRKPASEFLIQVNRLQISLMIRDPDVAKAFKAAGYDGPAPSMATADRPHMLNGGAAAAYHRGLSVRFAVFSANVSVAASGYQARIADLIGRRSICSLAGTERHTQALAITVETTIWLTSYKLTNREEPSPR
jgi:hypothetical protein